ncbi:MAG: hypothetical protein WC887_03085 [Candidatus Paceibacterota bacterium]|jgi:hypothetical protein
MSEKWKLDSSKVPQKELLPKFPDRGIEDAEFEPVKEEVPVQKNAPKPEEEDYLQKLFSEGKLSPEEERRQYEEREKDKSRKDELHKELINLYGGASTQALFDVTNRFGYICGLLPIDKDEREAVMTKLEAFMAEQREKMGKLEPVEEIKSPAGPEQSPEEEVEEDERSKLMNSEDFKKKNGRNKARILKRFDKEHPVNTDNGKEKKAESETPKEPLRVVEEENQKQEEIGTPKEARDEFEKTLREAVARLDDPERVELSGPEEAEIPEEGIPFLTDRLEEIDIEAEKNGGVIEKYFRKMGETYNKLSTREKIGTGIALGLGAGGLMAVSVPAALVFCGGIWAQRVAGAASMFMKYESATLPHDEEQKDTFWKWGAKEKAMGKAMAQSAVMTGAMLLLAEGVERGVEWLGHYWPDHAEITTETPVVSEHPAAAAAAGESAASVPLAPEIPSINVEASPGHGYEYMVKRLWEQLPKDLDASKFDADSDIHKLLTADAASIDTVVHQIASDPEHGFFTADGSVQINPNDHIFIAADGQVHLSHDFYNSGPVQAPADAVVTPAYSPETETPVAAEVPAPVVPEPAPLPVESNYKGGIKFGAPKSILNPQDYPLDSHSSVPEVPSSEVVTRGLPEESSVAETTPSVEPTPPQVTYSNDVMNTRVFADGTEHKVLESTRSYSDGYTELTVSENGHTIERVMTDPEGHIYKSGADGELVRVPDDEVAAHTAQVETPAQQPEASTVHENIVVNSSGVEIATDEPHFYADADDKHIFAYGGASAEEKLKAIKEYLTTHPDQTVYSADANGEHRIPWHITDKGELIGVPEKTNGILGFLKSFVKAPEPDEFVKLIK